MILEAIRNKGEEGLGVIRKREREGVGECGVEGIV